jgi:hypothetical protein
LGSWLTSHVPIQAIFPVYFGFQTALPVVLALTWPGERLASVGGAVARQNAGYKGLFADENFWIALTPIALMFGTSLLNLVWLGPATTKVMKERKHQGMLDRSSGKGASDGHNTDNLGLSETRDGKKYYDPGLKSPEMQRMNSTFNKLHGFASLANLVGLGAMLVYGFTLAEKM